MFTLSHHYQIAVCDSLKIANRRWSTCLVVLLMVISGCNRTSTSQNSSSSETVSASPDIASLRGREKITISSERSPIEWSKISYEPIWSQKIGIGYSSPVVWDDRIYLFHRQADEELIDCRDLQNGKLIWQFGSPTQFTCSTSFSNGPCSTPAIDSTSIYALGTEAKLYCLSRENGEIKQLRDLKLDYEPESNGWPLAGDLLLHEEAVITNLGGTKNESSIIAINCNTGATLWHQLDDKRSFSSPRIAIFYDQVQLLLKTENYFWSLDPKTGEPNWKYPHVASKQSDFLNAADAVVAGNRIILAAGKEVDLVCLQVQPKGRPKEVWRSEDNHSRYQSNLIILDHSIFIARENKQDKTELVCLSLKDGKTLWKKQLHLLRPTVLLFHYELILLGEKGNLAIWKADTQEPQLAYRTESPLLEWPCRTAPIVAQGKLILRNEQKLIAIELEKRINQPTPHPDKPEPNKL